MDRNWFLTWTTYGTWLPGDVRGFVGPVRKAQGERETHNTPGTPCDADLPGLRRFARQAMRGDPIWLTAEQARAVLDQTLETSAFRGWELLAAAVMANHVHLCVGVAGDPDPSAVLHSFKSYASRALNRRWPKPSSGTWWTESGSRRPLRGGGAVLGVVHYILHQERPLVDWCPEHFDWLRRVETPPAEEAEPGR
jgi:REP element-mobilizing transposase RayT